MVLFLLLFNDRRAPACLLTFGRSTAARTEGRGGRAAVAMQVKRLQAGRNRPPENQRERERERDKNKTNNEMEINNLLRLRFGAGGKMCVENVWKLFQCW